MGSAIQQRQTTCKTSPRCNINHQRPSMPVTSSYGSDGRESKVYHTITCNSSICSTGKKNICRHIRHHSAKRRVISQYYSKTTHIMIYTFLLVCTMIDTAMIGAFSFSSSQLRRYSMSGNIQHTMIQISKSSPMCMSTQQQQSIENENTAGTTSTKDVILNPATTPTTSSSEYSFFDEAIIYIRAGSGGQGSSTYKKGVNNQNGPPDGGNGGQGGNIILQLDESLNTLAGLARYAWRPNSFGGGGGARRRSSSGGNDSTSTRVLSFRAENGIDGARQNKQGRNGKDVVVRVPPGTVVQEEMKQDDDEELTYIDVGTITTTNPTLIPAYGGSGGEGSSAEKLQRGVRRARIPPQGGQRKRLKLTLKVVADVSIAFNMLSLDFMCLLTFLHIWTDVGCTSSCSQRW